MDRDILESLKDLTTASTELIKATTRMTYVITNLVSKIDNPSVDDTNQSASMENHEESAEDTHSDPGGSIMDDIQKDLDEVRDEVMIQDSHGIILGKKGKSYIFSEDRVRELIENDKCSIAHLAELAGVNVITMRKYANSLGLVATRKKKSGEY